MSYHLFISHAWDYNEDYYNLCNLLDNASNFDWKNYSVPKHDPFLTIGKSKKEIKVFLEEALKKQINPASVVIVIAGMYANYSDWIEFEVEYSQEKNKPIIVVDPRGQERTPVYLQNVATKTVKWNTSSIIEAIKEVTK
jgi:nuclease